MILISTFSIVIKSSIYYLICGKNMNDYLTDVSEVKDLVKASMEDLLQVNGFINSKPCFKIYKDCCWKLIQNLQGAVSHPGLILHLLLFNTEYWPEGKLKLLREKQRIKVRKINLLTL